MTDDDFESLRGDALMKAYQFIPIGTIEKPDDVTFTINITLKEALLWEKSVYIFLFDDKIKRVGSSKGKLGNRMRQWNRDVTNAMLKLKNLDANKTNTPEWEAEKWNKLFKDHGNGIVYARKATVVTTPVGEFAAYMDEESILIGRHKPCMNRHKNR